jgi:hypothetical protein
VDELARRADRLFGRRLKQAGMAAVKTLVVQSEDPEDEDCRISESSNSRVSISFARRLRHEEARPNGG